VAAQRIYVGKNLTRAAALKAAKKKARGDWRGFSYSKTTGYARLV
jgi:hypothetical protein